MTQAEVATPLEGTGKLWQCPCGTVSSGCMSNEGLAVSTQISKDAQAQSRGGALGQANGEGPPQAVGA